MLLEQPNTRKADLGKILALGTLVIIATFPKIRMTYAPGIDGPLTWVFNYISQQDMSLGKNIIFPHGPLAYFMYPLADKMMLVMAVTACLKIMLVYNLSCLIELKKGYRWLIVFSTGYLIAVTSEFFYLIFINVILLYCNYFLYERAFFNIAAFLLTTFACYIKSNLCIVTGVLYVSFIVYYVIKNRKIKNTAMDVFMMIGFMVSFWLVMYGTTAGFINYYIGMYNLALGNSDAVSLYPENNWWVLSAFLVGTVALPVINRNKRSGYYFILTFLAFFAAWKYGMAREDGPHYGIFILYSSLLLFVYVLFEDQHVYRNILLASCLVILINLNYKNTRTTIPRRFDFFSAVNFGQYVFRFPVLRAGAAKWNGSCISKKKLPWAVLDSIGNTPVDVYPWDYTIIAANHLNWKPRVVIQSYTAYTHWLDSQDAAHFNSTDAPGFIIWDMQKVKPGNPCDPPFYGIDMRYLLNDEPQTMVAIMQNYGFYSGDEQYLILKKRVAKVPVRNSIIASDQVEWGQWINVPVSVAGLLRARVNFGKSFLRNLKSFFYKDEAFYIILKYQDGKMQKYKIVPRNACDGIWINPHFENLAKADLVQQVMFDCTNPGIMVPHLQVDWEATDFISDPGCLFSCFNYLATKAGSCATIPAR